MLKFFLVRGFQGEELILLTRLSLHGHGAARLHAEVLELVAAWDPADPARRLHGLNATKTAMALAELETSPRECLPVVDEAIQCQLRKTRSTRDKRLARIKQNLELAPAAIPYTFAVATAPRAEPVGAIVLWPLDP
jgi:predicted metal-dependent phosphoesterase TrpH